MPFPPRPTQNQDPWFAPRDAWDQAVEDAIDNHQHAGEQITSGTVPTERLGSGAANSDSVLYGDQTWKPAPTGGGTSGAIVQADEPSSPYEGMLWYDTDEPDSGGAADTFTINVRDYAPIADGITPDNVAFSAAFTALANATRANLYGDRRLANARVRIPAGTYLITDESVFLKLASASTRGLMIEGDGPEATQIVWKPAVTGAATKYLIRNEGTGWLVATFRDMSFVCDTLGSNFLLSNTGDPSNVIQNYVFERCNWNGAWGTGVHMQGVDNNSESAFNNCFIGGSYVNAFHWAETSDQFVSYNWTSTHAWLTSGILIRHTTGGNTYWRGGSMITLGTGVTFFKLEGTGHWLGTCNVHVSDARVELRHSTARLIDSEWDYGTITFDNVDTGTYSGATDAATWTTAVFRAPFSTGTLPLVRWASCTLMGRHEYQYNTDSHLKANVAVYEDCEICNHSDPSTFIVNATGGGTNNLGGAVTTQFLRPSFWPSGSRYDVTGNWRRASRAQTSKKTISVRKLDMTNPANGESIDVALPLGAVITGAGLYIPPHGSSTSTTWSLTFRTTEASPATILALNPGTQLQLGGTAATSTLMRICDTTETRTIRLIAAGTFPATSAVTGFVGYLEYIG